MAEVGISGEEKPHPRNHINNEEGNLRDGEIWAGMILRNHTYLKAYKCWRILQILKTPTIKCLPILFKKYFNFQGFYMVYIIIW